MGSWVDPRFGPGWPNCDANGGRRTVRCDLGLGSVFNVTYQSGGISALLIACADVKKINDDPSDDRKYKVTDFQTYNCRSMRTVNKASLHSWPVAVDVNPANNGMNEGRGDIPIWFADCFENHGFEWGQAWNDPMHFENPQWYGQWDGTYPEVDDLALTATEKNTLAYLGAHEDDFNKLFAVLEGVKDGMGNATTAGAKANNFEKFGFRMVRKLNLDEAGP